MVSRIAQWTLDVQDVETMARFWSAALGYRVVPDDDGRHGRILERTGAGHVVHPERDTAAETGG